MHPISEERAEAYRTEENNGELTIGAGGPDGALDVYNLWLLSPIVGAARSVPGLRADLCL
jgi:hypothetical protein